ncbi:LOW QUALITY PROTEIN: atrophin-1-like [Portunus trituberculatus]|uniref:LOW QUALITY PROTEIN: atrophin-1-like n=1 Tax=Portunus trituberculatus TaxID=210409 RepID=UPI001E1D1BE3|nr:LOW QUALITY PROTEIN: atrophin-1-like [Portunus trituberculatus]
MSEYCLRWNNHRPNLVTVFSELLTSEALVDVTLATDGHYIHAHKLVLSACSVYFKDLFGANPCKHPIVILKDIRIEDLKTVIDFIYRGEVNVAQDRLQDVLRTAESLRIKGLAENPRSYDELSSHSTRFMGSQTSRQRSSMTDSREQSLSVEGEEEGEAATPPPNKKRKMTSSHDSSESVQEEGEGEERGGGGGREVKDEPPDDPEERPSREGSEQDSASMGGSQEGVAGDDATAATTTTTTITTPGTSTTDPSLPAHAQGRGKRGVLQRQQVIIRESASSGGGSVASIASVTSVGGGAEEAGGKGGVVAGVEVKGEGGGGAGGVAELIVPDTVVVSGGTMTLSSAPTTLLQVPTLVVGPRDALPKQHSHPTPLLTPTPVVTKQLSHPEGRGPPTHAGHPAITKQRSQPTVVTHAPSLPPLERLPLSPNSAGATVPSSQHLQVIPYPVLLKQRSAGAAAPLQASSLRPIQPKPSASAEAAELPPKKDVPLIRLTPSEDSGGGAGGGGGGGYGGVVGPPRLPRAASEEPALTRHPGEHSGDLLAPGPSVLVQSVSQDSGLEAGPPVSAPPRLGATPLAALTVTGTPMRSASSPGHCPVLRGGPALGCNFCWNSTDPQGRVLRRKTKYHCPECRTNLCIVPCFHEYHKQIERVQESDKQISKILTKTGSI